LSSLQETERQQAGSDSSIEDGKISLLGGATHLAALTEFRAEHVFDKLGRHRAKIDIRLDQRVVHSPTGIRFKQLTFQLKIADRHHQFLSRGSAGRKPSGEEWFGKFSKSARNIVVSNRHQVGPHPGLLLATGVIMD